MGHVEECLKNHANCPKPVSNGRLPTRVIDVLDPDHPHLFVSGDTHGEPYAALSYVWGEEQPNRTTLSNISTYVASIDLTLIPRTIREAMDVARRMGLRYLWVDSFCIIQDSRKDKTREIMQLRRIFRDAYITIIAASASSASSGFLEERSPPAPSPAAPRLPYWCADGRLGRVTAEPLFVSYEESRDEPANRRAWCLEERLLSPRRLVYANDTLQYHCQTSITYAGGALGRARTAERLPSFLFLPDAELAARVSQWKPFEWRAFQTEWLDVVMNYTRRLVTKPKDKLTALAGLAELFHRVWHHAPGASKSESNRYLAGLWGTILVHDLLWKRRNDLPVPFAPRPSRPYIAPSWSWASVDGPIDLWSGYDPRLRADIIACAVPTGQAKIMSCDVTVEDEGLPHGRVKDGLLRLQAKLIPTSWNPSLAGARLYLPRHQPGQSLRMMEAPLTAYEDLFSCVAEVFIDSADEVEGQVWAVPILWTRTTENADMYAAGLLITRGEDGIHYRRVGMWQTLEPDCTNDLEGDEEWEGGFQSDRLDESVLTVSVETLLSWLVSFSEGDWSIIEIV